MINYDLMLESLISEISNSKQKPKLLLHSCCAPCSTAVLNRLNNYFNITVFYYNPCIAPKEEYEKRKSEQIAFINMHNKNSQNKIEFLEGDYEPHTFLELSRGLENEPEGGKRCQGCYAQRLEKTAIMAKQCNYNFFGTTLSVSPHKNAQWINEIGEELSKQQGVAFLFADFKKKNGYLNSIKFSKQFNLYRQNYCGCVYSLAQITKQ